MYRRRTRPVFFTLLDEIDVWELETFLLEGLGEKKGGIAAAQLCRVNLGVSTRLLNRVGHWRPRFLTNPGSTRLPGDCHPQALIPGFYRLN